MISIIKLFCATNILFFTLSIQINAQENTQLQCLKEIVSISLNGNLSESPEPKNIKACSFSRPSFLTTYPSSATMIGLYSKTVRGEMTTEKEFNVCKEGQINLLNQIYKNSKENSFQDLDAQSSLSKVLGAKAAFDAAYTTEVAKGPIDFTGCSNSMNLALWTWVISRVNNQAFLDEYLTDPRLIDLMENNEKTLAATWYIAQHADSNLDLQKKVLKLLQDLFENKGTTGRYLAKLTDEILDKEKKKQKFGTFLTCKEGKPVFDPPLENLNNIDSLRKEYDLKPIAEILAKNASRCSS